MTRKYGIIQLWICFGMALIPSNYYVFTHTEDPEAIINSLIPILGFVLVLLSYITFVFEGHHVVHLFVCLRTLVKRRSKSRSMFMYADAERKSYLVTKWPPRVTCIDFSVNSVIIAGHQILMDYIQGDIDPKHWTLTYQLSFPFDQHTYFGFLLVNILQNINVWIYFIILTLVIGYFLSITFYLEAICDDFASVIADLDNSVTTGYDAMALKLILAIQLQKNVMESFKELVKIVTGTIFVHVIFDTIFISATFFQLESTVVNFDTKLVMAIFASLVAVLSLLPYCYYASSITLKIQNMAYVVFESRWYELPVELQKNMKPIIACAQVKRTVNGYGLFNCDLEGFMKIIKTSLSYYVMFRSFSTR
ncbi:uncharacterized protein LOC116344663 isoform X2 [Contarinia nasturtii]|uniref:uncharacterized protein LOC116344663 isoform X2 n=1 Tax=Contarinia nasturtii TaxID=265458 RepID=UPI0012D4BB98|nr:uncharacterized protein LOC116344663 isoform X2 [Contarinia nasturtii]